MHSLVIVESPAKAKTIEKYLGKEYEVRASMGHLRDLPKSKLGVDVEQDFEPVYEPIKGKEELIRDLKTAAGNADTVYLATDPDREGEAISWHLKQLLNLPDDKARRVTFNEITKKVVRDAIEAPREIDLALVDAQQTRRILDRLVGYKLSPLLWKKIRRGLSAGRVQSVATRMVDDRDAEIEAFQPEEYWALDVSVGKNPLPAGMPVPVNVRIASEPGKDADSATQSGADSANHDDAENVRLPESVAPPRDPTAFPAHWHGLDGKKGELHNRADVDAVISETIGKAFVVTKVKRTEKSRNPAPPFTTSTLQQDASRKLNMTPRRTMAIAQQLYEGVEIQGEGAVGLITYMRTDSLRLSEEAISAARDFIGERYGKPYCPEKPRRYRAKGNAQDAHEAIRPSDVRRTPDEVRTSLTREQYQLYRLIWSRFVACQMSAAVYDSVSVDITALPRDSAQAMPTGNHVFRATSSALKFNGFTAVYEEGRDDEKEESNSPLPTLQEGQILCLRGYDAAQKFTQPPAHYTDATLIRAMEEEGIGRPSTYAPTVSTILDRQYVMKEGKYLHITSLGRVVTQLMKERFSDIADVGFTARMEEALDAVEEGQRTGKSVLRGFYGKFDKDLQDAETALEGVRIKVPEQVTEEICPVCGRNLVIKSGRFGPFLSCPGYPECAFAMPLVEVMPGRCPKCGGRLMKRTGVSQTTRKPYTYYCCENQVSNKYKTATCDFRTWDIPVKDDCPVCGQTMFKLSGKGKKKAFCINPACPNFLPEDQRGYYKKAEKSDAAETESGKATESADETPVKKASAKKSATVKKTAAKKSTTAKKTTEKKSATAKKSTTEKKSATRKKAASDADEPAKKSTRKKAASDTEKPATAKKSTTRKKASDTDEPVKKSTRKKAASSTDEPAKKATRKRSAKSAETEDA